MKMPKLPKIPKDMHGTLLVLAGVTVMGLIILNGFIDEDNPDSMGNRFVRRTQKALIGSALTVAGLVGVFRLVLGAAIGGPILWGVTAGTFALTGGFGIIKGLLPGAGGSGTGTPDDAPCPPGFQKGPGGVCFKVDK